MGYVIVEFHGYGTKQFNNAYTPFIPLLVIILYSYAIFSKDDDADSNTGETKTKISKWHKIAIATVLTCSAIGKHVEAFRYFRMICLFCFVGLFFVVFEAWSRTAMQKEPARKEYVISTSRLTIIGYILIPTLFCFSSLDNIYLCGFVLVFCLTVLCWIKNANDSDVLRRVYYKFHIFSFYYFYLLYLRHFSGAIIHS
jgi:hypothetical protein